MESTPLTPEQIMAMLALGGGSGPNASANPTENPDAFEFFAFVVDGKVSIIFTANKDHMQDYITAFSSSPTVVKLASQQKNVVTYNWNYNSQSGEFSQPE
jgi:glyoxylate utilization-related uncharacterized protein